MRRSILLLFCFAVFLTFTACGGGAADDPKAFLNESFDLMEAYFTDFGKVETADDAVAVLDKYTKEFIALSEKGKFIKEKHPELFKGMKTMQFPEGYEDLEKRAKEIGPKLMSMMSNEKLMEIMQDPKVVEAQQKFMQAMQSMDD